MKLIINQQGFHHDSDDYSRLIFKRHKFYVNFLYMEKRTKNVVNKLQIFEK